jgi:cell wall-associated NlpC family hydrolase
MRLKLPFRLLLLGSLLLLAARCNVFAPAVDPRPPSRPDDPPPIEREEPTSNNRPDREDRFRADIVRYAKQFQGRPYQYAGRDPRTGFDCSGFTHYVMDNFDIYLSPSSRAQEDQGQKIRVDQVQAGDLIFYRRSAGGRVFHVSLVVDNGPEGIEVIHSTSRGVVIDNISTSSYWAPKISTARDIVSSKF